LECGALARASASIISMPNLRPAPMNSPTITPISAKETAGINEAFRVGGNHVSG
jgi:hypothetical protein